MGKLCLNTVNSNVFVVMFMLMEIALFISMHTHYMGCILSTMLFYLAEAVELD